MEFSKQVREYVKKEFNGSLVEFQTKYDLKLDEILIILSGKNDKDIDKQIKSKIKEDMTYALFRIST